jgi:hypothetical protein
LFQNHRPHSHAKLKKKTTKFKQTFKNAETRACLCNDIYIFFSAVITSSQKDYMRVKVYKNQKKKEHHKQSIQQNKKSTNKQIIYT